MATIGDKIKAFRGYYGYSQPEFARMTGISQKTIHNCEAGKFIPKPETIAKIEKYFNVDLATVRLVYEKCKYNV